MIVMTEEASSRRQQSEALKRQIDALAMDLISALDLLTRDLQRSLLSLADLVEERMDAIGFGRLSGPVVHSIQEGVKTEAKRFGEKAREKIKEIMEKKAEIAGSADVLGAWKPMTAEERGARQRQLQGEIEAREKSQKELEAELAEARVQLLELQSRIQALSTQDGQRIDTLVSTAEELQEQVRGLEAQLEEERRNASKITEERDYAQEQLQPLEAHLQRARERITVLEADLLLTRERVTTLEKEGTQASSLSEQIGELQAERQRMSSELATSQEEKQLLERQVAELQRDLEEVRQQLVTTEQTGGEWGARVAELEKQVQELTELRETHLQRIAELEAQLADALRRLDEIQASDREAQLMEEKAKLEEVNRLLKAENVQLEQELEQTQQRLVETQEQIVELAEARERLRWMESREKVRNILLQKNQLYTILTRLASLIMEGKYICSSTELGYSSSSGISLAAWLDRHFLELEEDGLVIIHRQAGGGMPSASIEVTEKGRQIFEEAMETEAVTSPAKTAEP